jgi:hypothetical protein
MVGQLDDLRFVETQVALPVHGDDRPLLLGDRPVSGGAHRGHRRRQDFFYVTSDRLLGGTDQ